MIKYALNNEQMVNNIQALKYIMCWVLVKDEVNIKTKIEGVKCFCLIMHSSIVIMVIW